MHADEKGKGKAPMKLQVYGASVSSVSSDIDLLMDVDSGKNPVYSEETGRVEVKPEIYETAWLECGNVQADGGIYCLILFVILLAAFAIVWAIVMLAFSIVTLGGFLKRRFRTQVIIEKGNPKFIGKLAVLTTRRGAVLNYEIGNEQYDSWNSRAFGLFTRNKYLRQFSLFLGAIWGAIEVVFKFNQVFLDPTFTYDLWPLRYVMIAIFVPLILYSPFLEMKFRSTFDEGDEVVHRLVNAEPEFSPEQPMYFKMHPKVLPKPSRFGRS